MGTKDKNEIYAYMMMEEDIFVKLQKTRRNSLVFNVGKENPWAQFPLKANLLMCARFPVEIGERRSKRVLNISSF